MNPTRTQHRPRDPRKLVPVEELPTYCDFTCPHAGFAPTDAAGACRREVAVYCSLAKRYNNKNARCIVRHI